LTTGHKTGFWFNKDNVFIFAVVNPVNDKILGLICDMPVSVMLSVESVGVMASNGAPLNSPVINGES